MAKVRHRAYMDASIHDYVNSVQTPDEQEARFIDPSAAPARRPIPTSTVSGEEQRFANRVNFYRENDAISVIDARPVPGAVMPTEGEQMGGFLGGALDLIDDATPDDMGGIIRGESGWLGMVPGYRQTIGTIAGVAVSGGESVLNALYWGSEQSDHLASWYWSALPGGQQTFDMEWTPGNPLSNTGGIAGQVINVSAYQSAISWAAMNLSDASNAAYEALGDRGLIDEAKAKAAYDKATAKWALMFNQDFDPLDEDMKKKAFEEQLLGKALSGTGDFMWDIVGDPTMAAGAASSVLRYGSKVGKWTGLTNQSLRNSAQIEVVGHQIDEGLAHFIDPSQGRATGAFEHVRSFVDNEPSQLTDHVFVVNSNDPQLVMRVAKMIDPGMYDQGAALAKALFGERSGWEYLHEMRPDVFDALYSGATGADVLAPKVPGGVLNATQTAIGKGLVRDAQAILNQSTEVGRALDGGTFTRIPDAPKSKLPLDIPGSQVVTRAGARSATAARVGDAWRLGRAQGRWGSARVSTTTTKAADGGDGWVYSKVQAASGSRPVMIVRWAGRGRPTNIVHLKGGDGATSNTEVHAWLTHSKIDVATRTTLFDEFVSATGPEARRNILIKMEEAEVAAQAKRLGITTDAAMLAYNSYRSMRHRKLWEVRKSADEAQAGTAYTIDENGVPVHVAGLYSELDEAFPMLDTREFQRVVRSNSKLLQSYGRTLDVTVDTLDVLNNMWKVSVLLRLGYTMRNITEGALRSAAVMGTLAMHPSAVARVPSAMRYAAYRRIYRNRAMAQGRALSEAQQQLIAAEKAIADWQKAANVEEMFALQDEIRELRQLVKAATTHSQSRLWVKPMETFDDVPPVNPEDVAIGRTPAELAIESIDNEVAALRKRLEFADGQEAKTIERDIARAGKQRQKQEALVETQRAKEQEKVTKAALDERDRQVKAVEKARAKEQARYDKDVKAANKDAEKRLAEVDRLSRALDAKVDALHKAQQRIDDMLPAQNKNVAALAAARTEAQRIAGEIEAILVKMRAKAPKRNKVGEGGSVVGKNPDGSDIVYNNAFDGPEGEMARLLASADRTYSAVFETGFESRRAAIAGSKDWVKLDPADITDPAQWERYWDNLTIRYNQRYAFDPIISRWLRYGDDEGTMLADTRKMLMSGKGSSLRNTLRTRNGERLSDEHGDAIAERVDEYLSEVYRRYTDEMPAGFGLRERLAQGDVMPYEVQSLWAGRRPPVIPAPVEDGVAEVKSLFGHAYDKYQTGTGILMKYLGSIPETGLLRHPFYAAVYRQEQLRMAGVAKDQGANLNSKSVRASIERAAHREALKQTRRTMYTVERQSNISNLLRFAMPFFPAWENSIRTWGRIVWQNPAVLGAGSLLWDIPNSLGWVVDENGNKVEHSNYLTDSEKHFVVYPEVVLNAAAKIAGPDLPVIGRPGELVPILNTMLPPLDEDGNPMPIQTRQSSLNVVFPGGILDPGVGPMQTIPISLMLRGKPEFTEVLRKNIPEDIFNSLVPNGNPNTPIPDMFLPTTVKKIKYRVFAGEDENTAYLRLQDMMVQDEIVRLKMADQPLTERDMARVLTRARKFWDWTIGQAATAFTASTTYRSPFTVERQIWRNLLDDTTMTYSQKVTAFNRKMEILHPGKGQDFMTLTGSTSESSFGVDSTQSSFDRFTGNEDTVAFIADKYGEENVGMFTNIGNTGDPFSYSVYSELFGMDVDGKSLKSKMGPEELKYADDVRSGWQDYYLLVDELDARARKAGLDGYMQIDGVDEILSGARAELGGIYPGFGVELSKGFDSTKVNRTIQTARLIVSEAGPDEFRDNRTIGSLAEYLKIRDTAADALGEVEDSDLKDEIRDLTVAEIMRLRKQDMGFADFYDRYLSGDDFRKVAG